MQLLTTNEAATRLGVSARRVQAMIKSGRLFAQKIGRDWAIPEQELKSIEHRKPGRPRLGIKDEKNK